MLVNITSSTLYHVNLVFEIIQHRLSFAPPKLDVASYMVCVSM